MDETEHSLLPPLLCTRTFTEPCSVELDAEMTGPGTGEGGDGEEDGGGAVGDGSVADGDGFGTTSYFLTSVQDRYFVVSVKYGGESSTRTG